jgi:Flp pilus assembly protein TadG
MDDVMMRFPVKRKVSEGGNAIVETALMMPWIFFLFLLIVDFGFYGYAAIVTQNAARVAALATARYDSVAGNQTYACLYAKPEMRFLPNYTQFSSGTCSALPLTITATRVTAADDATKFASRVSVTYQTVPMIPIPGLMTGQLTITRTAEVRIFEAL